MDQRNTGLMALCGLLGAIAFGVIFVAPRVIDETQESAALAPGQPPVAATGGADDASRPAEAEDAGEDAAGRTAAADESAGGDTTADQATTNESASIEEAGDGIAGAAPEAAAPQPGAPENSNRQVAASGAETGDASDVPGQTKAEGADAPSSDVASGETADLLAGAEALSSGASAGSDDAATSSDGSARPSFDLLRVEPDGSTVIAGRSAPGRRLDIMNGGDVLASVDVGPSGDFATVFEEPLTPGDYQLTLRVEGEGDGEAEMVSEEVATISVPEDGGSDLLAMVTRPGDASRIVSRPGAPDGPIDGASNGQDADAEAPDAGEAQSRTEIAASTGTDDDPADAAPSSEAPSGSAGDSASSTEAGDTDAPRDGQSEVAMAEPAPGEGSLARTSEPEADASDETGQTPLRILAVEFEKDRLFVAGSAPEGATVRVYANDTAVGDDRAVAPGRFLVEGVMPLQVGENAIRVDMIEGGEVVSRAIVPFFRPEGDAAAAVAEAPVPDGAEPDSQREPDVASTETASDSAATDVADSADETSDGSTASGGSGETSDGSVVPAASEEPETGPERDVAAAASDDRGGETAGPTAGDDARETALDEGREETADSQPRPETESAALASSDGTTAGDRPGAGPSVPAGEGTRETAMVAPDESATLEGPANEAEEADAAPAQTEPSPEGSTAASTEEGDDAPPTVRQPALTPSDAASVIIRRGDTLWQISRRAYGRGVRYTTIYLANQDQIADPDMILPGQVFSVPDDALENAEQLHRQRVLGR